MLVGNLEQNYHIIELLSFKWNETHFGHAYLAVSVSSVIMKATLSISS